MENFLKIYIQKIQQNLKAVAFRTIQFFRARSDFSTTKKTCHKEFSTMQYPTESSTIILLPKQFLWAQGAICVRFCSLLGMIINFLLTKIH
jgi:hypothetical protein